MIYGALLCRLDAREIIRVKRALRGMRNASYLHALALEQLSGMAFAAIREPERGALCVGNFPEPLARAGARRVMGSARYYVHSRGEAGSHSSKHANRNPKG
jgi:hypothetical protein